MSDLSDFEEFCGGELWDRNLTWDTNHPDFTPCFEKTVISWIPGFVLFILGPFELAGYLKSKNRNIPFNVLNVSKILFTLGLVAISIAELILTTTEGLDIADVDYVTTSLFVIFYLFSLVLLMMSLKYGVHTSATQFFFYLLSVFCGAIILRSVVQNRDDDEFDDNRMERLLITYSIQYSLICALFLLNLLPDQKPTLYDPELEQLEKPCPRITASFASKLYFIWNDKLMWTGYRSPLTPEKLWDPQPSYTSRGVIPQFDKHYDKSVANAKKKNEKHSVTGSLFFTFGPMFFSGAAIKFVNDVLAMCAPLLMKQIINFVESYADPKNLDKDPLWRGYFFAVLLLAIQSVQSVMLSQYFEKMYLVGMNLRTAMISMIYRKSLKMSGAAKKESTLGETVNLMSVDIQRFMDLIPYLNMLWSAPLQIALSCYFIYQELGTGMFSGLIVLILMIPINAVIAGLSRKFQLDQMKAKDERVKLMNEILGGVKVLKLYGWEQSFIAQVLSIRWREIIVLKKAAWMMAGITFIWISVPFMVALACFATYIFIDENNLLTPQKAYVTLSYLNIMRMPMSMLPFVIIGLVQVSVSLGRINKYMNNDDLQKDAVARNEEVSDPIIMEKATFKWGKDEPVALSDINVRVKERSLTAVVGTVGSGKSSLISAMLGEMEKIKGWVNLKGQVAYVPQVAWMQNTTLEKNILFGKDPDNLKYDAIVDACALRSDISILPGGDQTEIGEKGINLSGGQKQRVSLARAVYGDADVYLLDDPLSAVDSHVGKHIFDKVISHDGVLQNKTRVLVTHGITYLPKTDYILVVKDGKISEQGTYQELLDRKGAFAEFLIEFMAEEGTDGDEEIEDIKHQLEDKMGADNFQREFQKQTSRIRSSSVVDNDHDLHEKSRMKTLSESSEAQDQDDAKDQILQRQASVISDSRKQKEDEIKQEQRNADKQQVGATLIEKEAIETGSVKFAVYSYYLKNIGITGVIAAVIIQIVYQALSLGTNYWLNVWTSESLGPSNDTHWRNVYLGVYGGLGLGQAVFTLLLTIILSLTTLTASKKMHKTMLERVLRSPMAFFDTTPLGRIVNRFAKDVDVCDNTLPQNIRSWMTTFASFMGTIILIMALIPFFTAIVVPIAIIFFFIQTIYVNTSRQLKRLESISRSPIYSHFGETITGAGTIRAFSRVRDFELESENKVDTNQICYYPSIIANRWLAIRLEFLGNLITFAAAIICVYNATEIGPSEVGLIISYALNVTQTLNWLVRMTSDVETNIVAVERMKEYSTEIEQEADWEHGETKPDRDWPQHGKVEFQDYGMRYRPGLDLVVKDINCNILGGQTVGIVGRTGAGKSSLTVALFRLVEPAQGRIVIDGLDVSKMALHDLRKKLTIIPQDPVLFSGTLRINLDPFTLHSDQEIWKALELAHLKDFVSGLDDGLQHMVSEGGENVSVGQRQLICLARALLRKTKVLILDEATAAVDLETDELIQSTIRQEFAGCTVLTIAHRLNTIMDYDKIVVMDKGHIVEFDSPQNLLANESTIFYGMARDANLV